MDLDKLYDDYNVLLDLEEDSLKKCEDGYTADYVFGWFYFQRSLLKEVIINEEASRRIRNFS